MSVVVLTSDDGDPRLVPVPSELGLDTVIMRAPETPHTVRDEFQQQHPPFTVSSSVSNVTSIRPSRLSICLPNPHSHSFSQIRQLVVARPGCGASATRGCETRELSHIDRRYNKYTRSASPTGSLSLNVNGRFLSVV